MKRWFGAAALAATGTAQALPMAGVDSWMVMGDFASGFEEVAANYALTRNDALGFTLGRDGGDYAALTYTRLLKRWNLPHAQANLWFIGSVGTIDVSQQGRQTMSRPVLMADFETTRLYASATLKTMRARSVRHDSGLLRAGFSFYEVEYDEIQPWFVLQVEREIEGRRPRLKKETVTPMLRLIDRRWFVELGARRSDGRTTGRFNFMWTH